MKDKNMCNSRKEYLWDTGRLQKENSALYIYHDDN